MEIGEIATFFWLIAWILLIARTSVLIAECFFDDMWARLKMVSGHTAGPEGRSGGRSEARSAERRPERRPEGPADWPRPNTPWLAVNYAKSAVNYAKSAVNDPKKPD